ncbi:MAG: hypothetical protein G01um10147_1060 [Microgenomates group bacterium Gr01-1014_7]|nr:MAG: hypothetical protein G01um10147_1060 [Microgenomates group bacterium Gr01-1014_7]
MSKAEISYIKYNRGDELNYTNHTLQSNGTLSRHSRQDTVVAVRGGGFYGRVLLLKDQPYVVKTTQPGPTHDLLRTAAWGFRQFPSQVSERAAQLDCLATNLISDVLPIVTEGQFYSPKSFGYARLPNGYAQLIEKVEGRGPKFAPTNEFESFRAAQRNLTAVAYSLGLEQAGQVHPDNPFALANLWYSDSRDTFIWLDTLAAFRHEPIFGVIPYKFHQDIHDRFYPNDPTKVTYNRIHADRFADRVKGLEGKFEATDYRRMMDNLHLYQELLSQEDAEQPTTRDLKPALSDVKEIAKGIPAKVVHKVLGAIDLGRSVFDPNVRKRLILEGLEKGVDIGYVSAEEASEARGELEAYEQVRKGSLRLRLAETVLAGIYAGTFFGTNSLRAAALGVSTFSEQELLVKGLTDIGILLGTQLVSSGARFLGTSAIGLVSRVDLRAAARASVIPIAGNFLPFSAQALVNTGSENGLIWHYAVRDYIAKLSALHPAGGWGTQYEAELYNRFGPHIENLAVKKN